MATYNVGGFSLNRFLRPCVLKIAIAIFHVLDRHPSLGRFLLSFFRLKPVWRIGQTVVVTGDRQVRDMLQRDDDFVLPDKRAEKFPAGAFVLGMTRTPQFVRERQLLEDVVTRADGPRIAKLVDDASRRAIAAVKQTKTSELDVVSGLCSPVGQDVLEQYFGLTSAGALLDDLRLLGAMVASPHSEEKEFRRRVDKAAQRIHAQVSEQIDFVQGSVTAPPTGVATVLERLIWRWKNGSGELGREDVRRNITGVLLPGSALVARAFTTALVQLFRRKELRTLAYQAHQAGDRTLLEGCLMEALRFHPVFPIVPRYCPRATALPGFRSEYRIQAGRSVYAAVGLAMFDGQAALFQEAGAGRPVDVRIRNRNHYRHFGGGAHECLGQHIALPQMAAMLHHLLSLDGLKVGRIRYQTDDGISPAALKVTFTP